MTHDDGVPSRFADASDEELARLCADGQDDAERALLQRHMQAIYWLPQQAFGAPEEMLSGFFLYAIEKIRERDILFKFDPERGVRFTTWFGVILRNLFLDYMRKEKPEALMQELALEPEDLNEPADPQSELEEDLLGALQDKCRVLFKLLLCNTYLLTPADLRWIREQSGRPLLEISESVAALEDKLCDADARVSERFTKLAQVNWWKRTYERQLQDLERQGHLSAVTAEQREALERKLLRRQGEYHRLSEDLAGSAGLATAPYKDLAGLLNMPEGTLASQISRCRASALQFVRQYRKPEER